MFKQSVFTAFLCFACYCLHGQKIVVEKISGHEVTLASLQEKVYAADTTAPAAYLYRKGKSWFEMHGFSWFLMTEVSCRIKIYKKSGFDYANQEVLTYSRGETTDDVFTEAYSYNLNGTDIEKTQLDREGIFTDVNEYFSRKRLTMPKVKEGSIVEYTYRVKSPFFVVNTWYFQQDIPVSYTEYQISIPEFFSCNRNMKGFVKVSETEPVMLRGNSFQENRIKYTALDIPVLKEEAFVNNIKNYTSSVRFEISSVNYDKGETAKRVSTDWQAVANNIYEDEDFGKQLEMKGYFRRDLSKVVNDNMSRAEKAAAVLKFVQQRMAWNGELGYDCDTGVKEAFAAGKGNVGEINLMLTAMLRDVGLDANPVLVSTRENGINLYPSITAYNYVIAAALIDGKNVLLDATSKYTIPDVLPVRAVNWAGRMIVRVGAEKENRFFAKEIPLESKKISKQVNSIIAKLDEKGIVNGRTREQYYDYFAYMAAEAASGLDDEALQASFEKNNKNVEARDYKVLNKDDPGKPLLKEYTFTDAASATVTAGRIYLTPLLYFTEGQTPFTLDERQYPVDFIFPFRHAYQISLEVPSGYTFEYMPSSEKGQLPGGLGDYNYTISVTENKIQLSFSYSINTSIIGTENYKELKDFYAKLIQKQTEKIILKKV